MLIEDENDNFPQFKHDHQTVYVDENERRTAVIYQFFASDKDLDQNSILKFDIIGKDFSTFLHAICQFLFFSFSIIYFVYFISQFFIGGNTGKKFSIDQNNGELRAQPLDREDKGSYILKVIARDNGSPSRTSTATLTIIVNDENDNSPVFYENYDLSIPENTAVGQEIAVIKASDQDEGSNAKISYYLDQDTQGLFRIEKKTGKLRTRRKLDREKQKQHQITTCAMDSSPYKPRTTCTSIRITLKDINDNAPEFQESAYFHDVFEATKSTTILSVKATDKDEGENAKVSYSVRGGSQYFSVSMSGEIKAKINIPSGSYSLTIVAKDFGFPQLNSSVPVRIRVGNVPTNKLQFTDSVYTATINENSPKGTQVTNVRTSGSGVVYTFISGNELDTFNIDNKGDYLFMIIYIIDQYY